MNKQTQRELLNLVKKNYREIAGSFNQTRGKFLWPGLIDLTKSIKDGDKILDAGCGNGRLIEAFQDKQVDYLGVDSSRDLIEAAWKKYEAISADRQSRSLKCNFIVGDILELNKLPQLNFDLVFSIAVLHHLPGDDLRITALKQLKNKVKKNGKIIITVWNLWSRPKYRKLIIKFALLKLLKKNNMDFGDILFDWKNNQGRAVSRRYYHAFTKRGLKKVIRKSGLGIEKMYKDKYNYYLILKK